VSKEEIDKGYFMGAKLVQAICRQDPDIFYIKYDRAYRSPITYGYIFHVARCEDREKIISKFKKIINADAYKCLFNTLKIGALFFEITDYTAMYKDFQSRLDLSQLEDNTELTEKIAYISNPKYEEELGKEAEKMFKEVFIGNK
jgi:hypothetical protein